jgi:hypothetical protein
LARRARHAREEEGWDSSFSLKKKDLPTWLTPAVDKRKISKHILAISQHISKHISKLRLSHTINSQFINTSIHSNTTTHFVNTLTHTTYNMSSRRLSPSHSLQKLRTAFSQSSIRRQTDEPGSLSPLSITTSSTSTTASPTPTQQPFGTSIAGFSFSNAPSPLFNMPESFSVTNPRRMIMRKKSCVEIEHEQERFEFDGALIGMVEPRPTRFGPAVDGIEEVLFGKV